MTTPETTQPETQPEPLSARDMLERLHQLGLSDYKLAEETGISQPTLNRISTGRHEDPKQSTYAKIAAAYAKRCPPEQRAS